MKKISDFLEKFKRILKYDKEIKETIISVIKDVIGIEINNKDIKIQNKILYIKTTPYIKNEIYIKKEKILKEIISLLKRPIKDIR